MTGIQRFDAGAGYSFQPAGMFHHFMGAGDAEYNIVTLAPSTFGPWIRVDYASVGLSADAGDFHMGAVLTLGDIDDNYVPLIAVGLSPTIELTEALVGVPFAPFYACQQLTVPFVIPAGGHIHLHGQAGPSGATSVWGTVILSSSFNVLY